MAGSGTRIIQDSRSPAEFFRFCANPPESKDLYAVAGFPRAVNTVYLYAHTFLNGDSAHKAAFHPFLKNAHSLGLKVHCLDRGDITWVTTDSLYAEQYVRYVLQVADEQCIREIRRGTVFISRLIRFKAADDNIEELHGHPHLLPERRRFC